MFGKDYWEGVTTEAWKIVLLVVIVVAVAAAVIAAVTLWDKRHGRSFERSTRDIT